MELIDLTITMIVIYRIAETLKVFTIPFFYCHQFLSFPCRWFYSESERDWRARQKCIGLSFDLRQSNFYQELEDAKLVQYYGNTSQKHQWVEEDRASQIPCDVVRGEPS